MEPPCCQQFTHPNEAGWLMQLRQYEDAEALAREALDQYRVTGGVPGIVNAAMTLADGMTRRGGYEEAARLMDEAIPMARAWGGARFCRRPPAFRPRRGRARGKVAPARQPSGDRARGGGAPPRAAPASS